MTSLYPSVSVESSNSFSDKSPPAPSHHHRSKSASETLRDDARLTFDKTIEGHYRNGKTEYRQVGALFITWKDDDLQCRSTEVDKLRELFENRFKFDTDFYEIPADRCETALQKKIADFCYKYDSPEDLAIIYYAGHAYTGEETAEFKLAAKWSNREGRGDPTAFFSDILKCLRLPRCDQLMILDCCFAARAFSREHVGKRKFELLTSTAHNLGSPAPHLPESFTKTLYQCLERLVSENPGGFSTSHLYREVYHNIPKIKPLLFDQARHSYGKIWLRPQIVTEKPLKPLEGSRSLKLTFRLNANPDLAVMNELALHLQFLPYVDQIRFEDLWAPQEQITNLMTSIVRAGKLRPLIQKIHARRQLHKITEMRKGENGVQPPPSLLKLTLDQNQNHDPAHDWSSATEVVSDLTPTDFARSPNRRKKSKTWPSTQATRSRTGHQRNGQLSTGYKKDVPEAEPSVKVLQGHGNGTIPSADRGSVPHGGHRKRPRSQSLDQESTPEKRRPTIDSNASQR